MYRYTMKGTDANGRGWSIEGEVAGNFSEALEEAQRDAFAKLTQGKAIFGQPGVGCRGPYKITRLVLERREANEADRRFYDLAALLLTSEPHLDTIERAEVLADALQQTADLYIREQQENYEPPETGDAWSGGFAKNH